MSLPSSGPLSMSQIRAALGTQTINFRLAQAEQGVFGINNLSAQVGSGLLLDGIAPFRMSNWRGYNNACQQVTISPSSATINQGDSVTLTANSASSYLWSTGATSQSITVSPFTNENFSVTGSIDNCNNTTATSTITVVEPSGSCQCFELQSRGIDSFFRYEDCSGNIIDARLEDNEIIYVCAIPGTIIELTGNGDFSAVDTTFGTPLECSECAAGGGGIGF